MDLSTVLVAAILPMIANMVQQMTSAHPAAAPTLALAPQAQVPSPSTPQRPRTVVVFDSPAPLAQNELHTCLVGFHGVQGIDILAREETLADLNLTPDIIHLVSISRLQELTGLSEGKAMKFQVYCKEWMARLMEKRSRN